jgi:hypothetical protein
VRASGPLAPEHTPLGQRRWTPHAIPMALADLAHPRQAGANSVRVFLHGHSTYTPEFSPSGFVTSPDSKHTLLADLQRYLRGAQQLGLLVTFVLWDGAALSNTSGEYSLFGSVPKLTSYIQNVLTPMVETLANEPVRANPKPNPRPLPQPDPLPCLPERIPRGYLDHACQRASACRHRTEPAALQSRTAYTAPPLATISTRARTHTRLSRGHTTE